MRRNVTAKDKRTNSLSASPILDFSCNAGYLRKRSTKTSGTDEISTRPKKKPAYDGTLRWVFEHLAHVRTHPQVLC